MGHMGTFCFVFVILRNPSMEIGDIIRNMSHSRFSLMHVLVFGGPSPIFTERERELYSPLNRNKVVEYKSSQEWQVARKGITPIKLTTLKRNKQKVK